MVGLKCLLDFGYKSTVNAISFIKVNVRTVVLRVYFNFKRVLSILPTIACFYIFSGLKRIKMDDWYSKVSVY